MHWTLKVALRSSNVLLVDKIDHDWANDIEGDASEAKKTRKTKMKRNGKKRKNRKKSRTFFFEQKT